MAIDKTKQQKRDWYLANKEITIERAKKYKEVNADKVKELNRIYRVNNKEKIQKWRNDNIEHVKNYKKKYKEEHKENRNSTLKIRKESDTVFKLTCAIRSNILRSFNRNGYTKKSKTYSILGCTFEEFKLHLESKFEPWMNWDNRGNTNGISNNTNQSWDIDHIIPLSSAKCEADIIKLNHYSNLQPLCSYTNRNIKRDKF